MLRFAGLALVLSVLFVAPMAAQEKNPIVVIETTKGTIKVELFPQKAPITVKNFLDYVAAKHYDDTVYHRVIKDFMIQGGGFTIDGKQKSTMAPIKNEATNGLSNVRGTIAMARTSVPDSATCQFFINVKDNPFLDRKGGAGGEGYCVFGQVVDGMEVVDVIRAVKTNDKDMPIDQVVIKSIRLVDKK